jgi:hypothetical protein
MNRLKISAALLLATALTACAALTKAPVKGLVLTGPMDAGTHGISRVGDIVLHNGPSLKLWMSGTASSNATMWASLGALAGVDVGETYNLVANAVQRDADYTNAYGKALGAVQREDLSLDGTSDNVTLSYFTGNYYGGGGMSVPAYDPWLRITMPELGKPRLELTSGAGSLLLRDDYALLSSTAPEGLYLASDNGIYLYGFLESYEATNTAPDSVANVGTLDDRFLKREERRFPVFAAIPMLLRHDLREAVVVSGATPSGMNGVYMKPAFQVYGDEAIYPYYKVGAPAQTVAHNGTAWRVVSGSYLFSVNSTAAMPPISGYAASGGASGTLSVRYSPRTVPVYSKDIEVKISVNNFSGAEPMVSWYDSRGYVFNDTWATYEGADHGGAVGYVVQDKLGSPGEVADPSHDDRRVAFKTDSTVSLSSLLDSDDVVPHVVYHPSLDVFGTGDISHLVNPANEANITAVYTRCDPSTQSGFEENGYPRSVVWHVLPIVGWTSENKAVQ